MTAHNRPSDIPPAEPAAEGGLYDKLRLLRSRRVGIATYRRLMAEHGSAAAALDVLPAVAQAAGVKDYAICGKDLVEAELQAGAQAGAILISDDDPRYPARLKDIDDAPPLLWAMGDIGLLARPMVALVGARNASSLGTRMAKRLGRDLAEAGISVVSGLARGVDAAAHTGALDGGTIAVQAGGVDTIYPVENASLANQIAASGLRLSEMPMGMHPIARHFPARNRIISGLAQAVVVVEAAAKSGSLITARNALDQGRDVLAVPGHPYDARAWGCNMLIREGALLVRSADDVLEAIACIAPQTTPVVTEETQAAPTSGTITAGALHSVILDRLGPSPITEDQLLRDLQAAPTDVAPALVDLEMDGKITRQAGGMLALSV